MKNTFFKSMILMLSFSLILVSCSTDDDSSISNNNSLEIQQIINTVESDTWRITSFIDSGQDETNDFTGYNFTFNANGTLVANDGNTIQNGTWSVTNSSNSSSSSSDDIDFNISFPVPDTNDFSDLNDDWDIVSHTSSKIDLIDISGGNGGTDTLTFERN